MGAIEKAIEDFREKQRKVYEADIDRVIRDARSADRTAKDHVGRWFFELFQNCDDACAEEVLVILASSAVYIADKGTGLKPTAIKSICGTDLSDKTGGTIGRKGVGFKAVYELTENPQVFTVNGEGVEFSPVKTQNWLKDNGFSVDVLPFHWIPFFLSRTEAEHNDPILRDLGLYNTVVKLPLGSVDKDGKVKGQLDWPTHALLPFRHVRKIQVQDAIDADPWLRIAVFQDNEVCMVEDSRLSVKQVRWHVVRNSEKPSQSLLTELSIDEQKRIQKDGITFLIGAPIEGRRLLATENYLPIHVFYPTEQEGPVRMLLHAEFLVKSDRTALIPIENNRFNQWVADRLANYTCNFVQNAYLKEKPSSNMALLVPLEGRENHPVALAIWERIVQAAHTRLLLGDVDELPRLTIKDAKLISVSVSSARARRLLEGLELRRLLLHHTFDKNSDARKALRALGCAEFNDKDMIQTIEKYSTSMIDDHEWVWTCWEWLAAWVDCEPYGDKHKERIEFVRHLPIVPVGNRLYAAASLDGHIISWRVDSHDYTFPEWLPLTFVEDWFRDRVQGLLVQSSTSDEPLTTLLKDLRIKGPSEDLVQQAVGEAIKQYWKATSGDPGRFLSYIFDQGWHETSVPNKLLYRCPVPVSEQGNDEQTWAEARVAYFGADWGNDLLVNLYEGIVGISWVKASFVGNDDKWRKVLEWLGCKAFPRVVEDTKHQISAYELPEECNAWRRDVFKVTGGRTPTVDKVQRLDHLAIGRLSLVQVRALFRLLAKYWKEYYEGVYATEIQWFYRTSCCRRIEGFWWYQIKREFRLLGEQHSISCPLIKCWLPDRRTERAIGDLLPIVDLEVFEDDKEQVRQWLIDIVKLRTHIGQITQDEWRGFLTQSIPELAPAKELESNEKLRDKVVRWYEACLDAISEAVNVPSKVFSSCTMLCRKGSCWNYMNSDEPRYLADEPDLVEAFSEDVWLLELPSKFRSPLENYFGIPPFSKCVEVQLKPSKPSEFLSGDLNIKFVETLPYIFGWRLDKTKQDSDKLRDSLKNLKVEVVQDIVAELRLNDIVKSVSRAYGVSEQSLILRKTDAHEPALAQALAEFLNVKSEADFYENLLRCKDDCERKTKVAGKGVTNIEIDRRLREYSEMPHEFDETSTETEGETHEAIEKESDEESKTTNNGEGSKESDSVASRESKTPFSPGGSPESKPLKLKDHRTSDYIVGPGPSEPTETGGGAGGKGSTHEQHTLSQQEKLEIEGCGRNFAQFELEKSGYSVEEMPLENPGFDLRARKGDEELRVEVKAHRGRGTIAEVTQRQYLEYLGSHRIGHGEYNWELWNIEHLGVDEQPRATITKYIDIPEEALETRTFRVDLRKCSIEN